MSREAKRLAKILELAKQRPAVAADGSHASIGLAEQDDCAVIPMGDRDLVVGSDFVRGEGFFLFELELLSWKDLGFYLVAANASDLAAMGARPTGVLVAFRTHLGMTEADHDRAMEGVLEACAEFEMPLLGGDSGGYSASVLSATALGTCPRGRALLRRNGRPGDLVYLSGDVGTAGAANAWFLRGRGSGGELGAEAEQALLTRWQRPRPALRLGALLVDRGLSACAIDTSDGLKAAARQLAQASEVDAVLEPDAIPIAATTRRVAEILEIDPLALAVGDSVDFRLLFAVPADKRNELEQALQRAGLAAHRIGRLERASGAPSALLDVGGERQSLPGVEWDQADAPTIDRLLGSH